MPTTTSGGTTTSFTNAPQAKDDSFTLGTEDFGTTYFDVMANDLGGNAKTLWSIDDTTQDGTTGEAGTANGTIDLLTQDIVGVCNFSDFGARIWMTADGKIGYNAGSIFNYLAAGDTATDRFTYAIRLGNGTLSWATVTVTVTGTNDAPEVSDVSASADEDGAAVTGSFSGDDVDSDDDGASLTYTITSDPDEGSVANNGDGTFSFDPGDDFQDLADGETREVTFTYTATDSHGETSNSGTVTVTVTGTNDAPEVSDVSASADEDGTAVTGSFSGDDVDSDDDGASLTYTITSDPDEGSVANNGDGTFSFDPGDDFQDLADGETREVTFTYTATDSHGETSNSGTVTVTVTGTNDAPELTGTQATLADGTEDTGYVVAAADLLAGFTDVDGGTLAVDGLTADHGSVTNNGDGTYTITPTTNHNGAVTLTYSVVDGQGGSSAATQSFDLAAVNDAAVITGAASGSITEDAVPNSVGGDLDSTDVDNPNDSWTAVTTAIASTNGYGSYTIDAAGNWVYTLDNDDSSVDGLNNGGTLEDSFTVTTADGTPQVVTITINGNTDVTDVLAPTDIKFDLGTSAGSFTTALTANAVLGSLTAVDGDSSTWSFSLSGANASLVALSPGSGSSVDLVVGVANIGIGNYSFTVTATDAGGNVYSENFTLSVGSSNGSSGDATSAFTITSGTDIDYALNGPDNLSGGGGDDALVGGNGTDTLNGGPGNDQLFGGGQNDVFVFSSALSGSTNVDEILDFNANNADKIHLDDAIFAGIGSGGVLSATDFAANAGGNATTASQNILYDTVTGNLYYDPDGTGAADKILFAQLTITAGSLDPTDFIVI